MQRWPVADNFQAEPFRQTTRERHAVREDYALYAETLHRTASPARAGAVAVELSGGCGLKRGSLFAAGYEYLYPSGYVTPVPIWWARSPSQPVAGILDVEACEAQH
jgi:hypothetical protein